MTNASSYKVKTPHFLLRGSLAAAGVALLIVAAGVALLGYSYDRYYAGRIFPGVTILDENMAGKTYAEARREVVDRANYLLDQAITLARADGNKEVITPRSIGFSLDSESLVYEAYQRGRTGSVFDRASEMVLLRASGAAFAFSPSIDADRILNRLEEKLVSYERPVTNASLSMSATGIVLTAEEAGIRVDREAVATQIEDILTNLTLPATIEIPTETIAPTINKADLQPLVAESRRLTADPVTLMAEEQAFTVSTETLTGWLVYDPTVSIAKPLGKLTWNQELVGGYIQGLAKKIDQPMLPRKINVQNGSVLDEGKVGTHLDRDAATKDLLAFLAARGDQFAVTATAKSNIVTLVLVEVPIEDKTVTPPFTPGLYEGKYIEVNLSEQTLYQWENSNLIASYTVSTGKWSAPTPQGVLYIKNHISYAYSRKFDLYMPWGLGLAWNPDGSGYEGYGIHELPEWKNGKKEGEGHLGTPVSHGCIRLGVGPAEAIYNWAEEGTPVYIHK